MAILGNEGPVCVLVTIESPPLDQWEGETGVEPYIWMSTEIQLSQWLVKSWVICLFSVSALSFASLFTF